MDGKDIDIICNKIGKKEEEIKVAKEDNEVYQNALLKLKRAVKKIQ